MSSAKSGFPARLETILQTLAVATTLATMFAVHHAHAREQAVTQHKLRGQPVGEHHPQAQSMQEVFGRRTQHESYCVMLAGAQQPGLPRPAGGCGHRCLPS